MTRYSIMTDERNKGRISEIRQAFNLKTENDVITMLIGILDYHATVPVEVMTKLGRRSAAGSKR